jgi:hypothetical protein
MTSDGTNCLNRAFDKARVRRRYSSGACQTLRSKKGAKRGWRSPAHPADTSSPLVKRRCTGRPDRNSRASNAVATSIWTLSPQVNTSTAA